jgi:molybdopterin-binding protein
MLQASSPQDLVGKTVVATVKPEDISLSLGKTSDLSPNGEVCNHVEGTITEMVQMRTNAQVTVDAGFPLKARVPLSVIKSLGVNLGDKVSVSFSANSLNVFGDDNKQ